MARPDWTECGRIVSHDPSFSALVMAAMRRADRQSLAALRLAFPKQWQELHDRDNAPAGLLRTDPCPECGNCIDDCVEPDTPVNSNALGRGGQYCLRMLYTIRPVDDSA